MFPWLGRAQTVRITCLQFLKFVIHCVIASQISPTDRIYCLSIYVFIHTLPDDTCF